MTGRNDSEWGQMGMVMMASMFRWIMEALAVAAYAMQSIQVETITSSPCTVLLRCLSS